MSNSVPQSVIVYRDEISDVQLQFPADLDSRTAWLTQKQMSIVFNLNTSVISRHITNFKEQRGDAAKRAIANFAITASDGKTYNVEHYNMTVVAYVGFRAQATEQTIAFQDRVGEQLDKAIRDSRGISKATGIDAIQAIVDVLREQERQIAEIHEMQGEQALRLDAVVDRLDDADYYTVRGWCRKQRIQYTTSLLIMWGKQATALSAARNIERKEVMEDDLSTGRYHKSVLLDVCVPKPKTNGQMELL